jgi:hypothetical protein
MEASLLSLDLVSCAGEPLEIGNGEHSALEGASKGQVLKELYSLTDVVYCKNRQLQGIQWVPQRKVQHRPPSWTLSAGWHKAPGGVRPLLDTASLKFDH